MENEVRQIAREEAEKLFSEKFASLNQTPELIAVKDFQKSYGVSAPTMYRHINNGHLNLIKLGGKSFLNRKQAQSLFVTIK